MRWMLLFAGMLLTGCGEQTECEAILDLGCLEQQCCTADKEGLLSCNVYVESDDGVGCSGGTCSEEQSPKSYTCSGGTCSQLELLEIADTECPDWRETAFPIPEFGDTDTDT